MSTYSNPPRSAWQWSDQYRQYYRTYENARGETIYEWQNSAAFPRSEHDTSHEAYGLDAVAASGQSEYTESNSAYTFGGQSQAYNTGQAASYAATYPGLASSHSPQTAQPTYSASGSHVTFATPMSTAGGSSYNQTRAQPSHAEVDPSYYLTTQHDGREDEQFDPSYKRVKTDMISRFFKAGRVFSVLWVEPSSRTGGGQGFTVVNYGQGSYAEIRRFIIVVNRGQHHSLCVPIMSYSGKGAVDRPDQEYHAVAYIGDTAPMARTGENLNKWPIKIIPKGKQTLTKNSRINFSKIYTVEHNLKVKEVGKVSDEHMAWVEYYFRESTIGTGSVSQPTTTPPAYRNQAVDNYATEYDDDDDDDEGDYDRRFRH